MTHYQSIQYTIIMKELSFCDVLLLGRYNPLSYIRSYQFIRIPHNTLYNPHRSNKLVNTAIGFTAIKTATAIGFYKMKN